MGARWVTSPHKGFPNDLEVYSNAQNALEYKLEDPGSGLELPLSGGQVSESCAQQMPFTVHGVLCCCGLNLEPYVW